MNHDLDTLMLVLLDPCLTTDEAAREAAARVHSANEANEARTKPEGRRKKRDPQTQPPAEALVGF